MNHFPNLKQLQYYFLAQSTAAILYYGSMGIVFKKPMELTITVVDRIIGFNDVFGYIYLSFFFLILIAIWSSKTDVARQCALAIVLNSILAGLIFIFFPTKMQDNIFQMKPDMTGGILEFIRSEDRNANCFPSMHISNAFTAVYYFNFKKSKPVKLLFWAWFGIIACSVISTKQHCLFDILGGILLAVVNVAILKKFPGKSPQNILHLP